MWKVSFSPVKLFLLLERNFIQKVVQIHAIYAFSGMFFVYAYIGRLKSLWSSISVVNFHIHNLLKMQES